MKMISTKLFLSITLVLLLTDVQCHIYIHNSETNKTDDVFYDLPAQYGPGIPSKGLKLLVVHSFPSMNGCGIIMEPPTPTEKYVLLMQRGNCSFENKTRNAQAAKYHAVIVYNNGDELEPMSASNSSGITIPSVFVTQTTGEIIAYSFLWNNGYFIVITDELPFNINTHLIIPFAILIVFCFVTMISYMVYKCIREQRRICQHRLPKRLLNKIPITKFTKGQPYEMCVICLIEFVECDKLRVLFCGHAYHAICIDPWLTKHKRVCPICKRKVFAKGKNKPNNRRQPRSSMSSSDGDDDTAPLLSRTNDSTNHGTFTANANSSTVEVETSDDESVLLNDQSTTQGQGRTNPFDRTPIIAPEHINALASHWNGFLRLFSRNPTVAHVSLTNEVPPSRGNQENQSVATVAVPLASNNILNTNLSGSFKDDDDEMHQSIYEPIGVSINGQNSNLDSNFIETPSRGGIGVVALPNPQIMEQHASSSSRFV